MRAIMKDKKGIALIMAIGVMALLAIVAVSFALNMRLEYRAASSYYNGVKANYNAEAALERTIYELKTHVQASAFDDLAEPWSEAAVAGDKWDVVKGSTSGGISVGSDGTAYVTILDEQRKVNVNTANAMLLENLFEELGMLPGDADNLRSDIVTNRPYICLQELIPKGTLTETEYNTIKDYVSVSTYIYDDSGTIRSPVNVNTCDVEVLRAVLRGLIGSIASISSAEATKVADDIINGSTTSGGTDGRPFSSWADFEACLAGSLGDGDGITTTDEVDLIISNVNPNKIMPMIASTTRFCFNSGGYYEIKGTGTIGPTGQEIATKEIIAIAKIYDIMSFSSKEDFRGEDANYNGALDVGEDINGNGVLDDPVYRRVTWMNKCPVNASSLFGQYSIPNPEYVEGALKIGYWDDFDEDTAYSQSEWIEPTHGFDIMDGDSSGGDNELCGKMTDDWVTLRLIDTSKWQWAQCSLRVWLKDDLRIVNPVQMQDVGWVQLNKDSGSSILLAKQGVLEWGGPYYRDQGGVPIWPLTAEQLALPLYVFPSQLRRFPGDVITSTYWTPHTPWFGTKTHNIRHGATGIATVWDSGGGSSTITYPAVGYGTMYLQFYAHKQNSYWDDLRIISADGDYTSITYTPIASGSNVAWGTMAFTGTEQTDTTISTDAALGAGGFSPVNLAGTAANGGGGSIGPTLANSIRYRVNFTSTNLMENTPIFEDITITYLPSTEIRSWSK